MRVFELAMQDGTLRSVVTDRKSFGRRDVIAAVQVDYSHLAVGFLSGKRVERHDRRWGSEWVEL